MALKGWPSFKTTNPLPPKRLRQQQLCAAFLYGSPRSTYPSSWMLHNWLLTGIYNRHILGRRDRNRISSAFIQKVVWRVQYFIEPTTVFFFISCALKNETSALLHHFSVSSCLLGIGRANGAGVTSAMLDDDQESRRASSRGIIPRAKIKTVKMTFVIVFGEYCPSFN